MTLSNPSPDTGAGTPPDDALRELASALCMDAQAGKYDHGEWPTLVSFQPPYCPRHLAIAANVRASLSRPATDPAGLDALLERIRTETREAVIEGDAVDCSSPDCIADAVYEIVRVVFRDARLSVADGPGPTDD